MSTLGEFIKNISKQRKEEIICYWETTYLLEYLEPQLKYFVALALEQASLILSQIQDEEIDKEQLILEKNNQFFYGENYYSSPSNCLVLFPSIRRIIQYIIEKSNMYSIVKSISIHTIVNSIIDEFNTFKTEYGSILFMDNIDTELEYCAWFSEKYGQMFINNYTTKNPSQ